LTKYEYKKKRFIKNLQPRKNLLPQENYRLSKENKEEMVGKESYKHFGGFL
jgi:hypothetical protein